MAAKKWLSVIIPCHNGEQWLSVALKSVIAQNDDGIEAIFVDSSDSQACVEEINAFTEQLDIRVFRRPDLLPWATKVNYGVTEAQADLVSILHVDDFWLPERAARLHEWVSSSPRSVMHLHPTYIVDKDGRQLGIWRCPLPNGYSAVPARLLQERLLVQNFIAVPAPTFRRDAFLDVGGMDESLWHTGDWDLYLKIATRGPVCYYDEPLACVRIHRNSLGISGSRDLVDFREQHDLVIKRHAALAGPHQNGEIMRLAIASINVNVALAAVNKGHFFWFWRAVGALLRLGPRSMMRYINYSRILERAYPRLIARITGRL